MISGRRRLIFCEGAAGASVDISIKTVACPFRASSPKGSLKTFRSHAPFRAPGVSVQATTPDKSTTKTGRENSRPVCHGSCRRVGRNYRVHMVTGSVLGPGCLGSIGYGVRRQSDSLDLDRKEKKPQQQECGVFL